MTFDARERSADQGAPIELFEFVRGTKRWRYAAADRDIVWSSNTYTMTPITRGAVEVSQEIARAGLRISCPRDLEVVDGYRAGSPSDPVLINIWQRHDTDVDAEYVVVWQGRILSVEFGGAVADIFCESVFTSMRRSGLRRAWQKLCPHVLYGSECKVNKADWDVAGTLTAVSGLTITAAAYGAHPSGYFTGGFIEWTNPDGLIDRRWVTGHVGTTLTLERAIPGLTVGQSVIAYPGCDRTTGNGGCTRFLNILNYGGTPYIPSKNPFGGDPLY